MAIVINLDLAAALVVGFTSNSDETKRESVVNAATSIVGRVRTTTKLSF